MDTDGNLSRRHLIATGAGLGALALAGCGSGRDGEAGDQQTSPAERQPQGEPLARLADITVGEAISAQATDGSTVIVARPSENAAAAFSAVCTHKGCTVEPAGRELHCPCHGSRYEATTGQVIAGPAPKPLPKIPVHVDSGEVVTGSG